MQTPIFSRGFLFLMLLLSTRLYALNIEQNRRLTAIYESPAILGSIPYNPPGDVTGNDPEVLEQIKRIFQDPYYTGQKMAVRKNWFPFPLAMRQFVLREYGRYGANNAYPPRLSGDKAPTNYPYQYAYAVIAAFADSDANYRELAKREFQKMIPYLRARELPAPGVLVRTELDKVRQSIRARMVYDVSREAAIPAYFMLLGAEEAANRLPEFLRDPSDKLRLSIIESLGISADNDKRRHPKLQVVVAHFLFDTDLNVRKAAQKFLGSESYLDEGPPRATKINGFLQPAARTEISQYFNPDRNLPAAGLAVAARVLGNDHYHHIFPRASGASDEVHAALMAGLAHSSHDVVLASAWAYSQIKTNHGPAQLSLFNALIPDDREVRTEIFIALGSDDDYPQPWIKSPLAKDALFKLLRQVVSGEMKDDKYRTLLAGLARLAHQNAPSTPAQYLQALEAFLWAKREVVDENIVYDLSRAVGRTHERYPFAIRRGGDRTQEVQLLLAVAETHPDMAALSSIFSKLNPTPAELFVSAEQVAEIGPKTRQMLVEYLVSLTETDFSRFLDLTDAEVALLHLFGTWYPELRRAFLYRLTHVRKGEQEFAECFNLPVRFSRVYRAIVKAMSEPESVILATTVIRDKIEKRGRWHSLPYRDVEFIAALETVMDQNTPAGDVARAAFKWFFKKRGEILRVVPPCAQQIIDVILRRGGPADKLAP